MINTNNIMSTTTAAASAAVSAAAAAAAGSRINRFLLLQPVSVALLFYDDEYKKYCVHYDCC